MQGITSILVVMSMKLCSILQDQIQNYEQWCPTRLSVCSILLLNIFQYRFNRNSLPHSQLCGTVFSFSSVDENLFAFSQLTALKKQHFVSSTSIWSCVFRIQNFQAQSSPFWEVRPVYKKPGGNTARPVPCWKSKVKSADNRGENKSGPCLFNDDGNCNCDES